MEDNIIKKNTDTTSRKRYDNIDLLKIIAIFMVIMLHTLKWKINFIEDESVNAYIQFFIRIFCEGVPIFILVNGFLIINKPLDLKKFLKKSLSIFCILVVWSFINIITIKSINSESINIVDILKNVTMTDINNKYTGPLWFLQNLIMLYLFFPILKVLHDENKKIYNYLFIVVTIFTMGIGLVSNILLIIEKILNTDIEYYFRVFMAKYNPISNGTFLFYFMLGGYLFEKKDIFEKNRNRIIAITIGLISCLISFGFAILISKISNKQVASGFNYSSIFMASFIIALYALTYKYKNKGKFLNKIIMDIGKNTLGIYLIHKILIEVIKKYIIVQNNWNINILFSLSIFVISYILVISIKRIPILRKVVEM